MQLHAVTVTRKDQARRKLLFNFDGTVRGGLGDPRQAQLGVRLIF